MYILINVLATTTVSTTSVMTDVLVMTPQDFENAYRQPVAIFTIASMIFMVPVNMIAMYALFIKLDMLFNPHRILANQRTQRFIKRISRK